jgi:glycosyltransferase involved in cell wall biosynthesis
LKKKLIRTSTVASSLDILLKGQLSFLNEHFEVIAISGQDNHLENVSNREKVQTINVAFQRHIAPIQDLISLFKLYKILKKEKPFIIHSITPKAGLLSMIAGYFAQVPIRIHTFTGLVFPTKTGFSKSFFIFMDRLLCQFATHIFPEGNGVKNDLILYKITNKPLKIIANGNINGIDLNHFNPKLFSEIDKIELRKNLNISNLDFVFIYVGRLVADKGINELVAAFEKIVVNNLNTKLLLVGNFENDLDPLFPETYKILENNNSVISVGFQEDVRSYFAVANALIFPSYREGFSNVVLQAGAMNLPSIVTNINGCNEIIQDNFNGLIIESKNENAVYDSMNKLLNDKDLVCKLASNSRNNIVARFEQSLVWNGLLEEYRKFEV